MKPNHLQTKIFLDGGDPEETKEIKNLLGFLDGQTTNPTLISKNPEAAERLARGKKFRKKEIFDFYKEIITEISSSIPDGSVSIEVYADGKTTRDHMIAQAREFFLWIPNAHIKFPTTAEGLAAAEEVRKEGVRVNMTLCFTQEQAAAIYAATTGAQKGDVFVSPFVGRLDDKGKNGMDLIKNILKMYRAGDGHVAVLTASVRSLDHFLYALALGSDIITSPVKILREWHKKGMPVPDANYQYETKNLQSIPYRDISLAKLWKEYDIRHDLTDAGIDRFAKDWNELIQ